MAVSSPMPAASKPWTPPAANASVPPATQAGWERLLPFIGPLILFILWDIAVRTGFIKALLLPPPLDALGTLVKGLLGGALHGWTGFLAKLEQVVAAAD